jgi:hypothetical protein
MVRDEQFIDSSGVADQVHAAKTGPVREADREVEVTRHCFAPRFLRAWLLVLATPIITRGLEPSPATKLIRL